MATGLNTTRFENLNNSLILSDIATSRKMEDSIIRSSVISPTSQQSTARNRTSYFNSEFIKEVKAIEYPTRVVPYQIEPGFIAFKNAEPESLTSILGLRSPTANMMFSTRQQRMMKQHFELKQENKQAMHSWKLGNDHSIIQHVIKTKLNQERDLLNHKFIIEDTHRKRQFDPSSTIRSTTTAPEQRRPEYLYKRLT